jgi:hypothetical protein
VNARRTLPPRRRADISERCHWHPTPEGICRTSPTCCPGGTSDNSPMFQRWVTPPGRDQVPKGRLKSCAHSTVPSGLMRSRRRVPNVETLGYSRSSLRDETHIPVTLIGCPRERRCRLPRSTFSPFPSNPYELMLSMAARRSAGRADCPLSRIHAKENH